MIIDDFEAINRALKRIQQEEQRAEDTAVSQSKTETASDDGNIMIHIDPDALLDYFYGAVC